MFHLSLHGRLAEVKNKTLHLKAFQRAFQFTQIKQKMMNWIFEESRSVIEADKTRQKVAKGRSLWVINDDPKRLFNEVLSTQIASI